MPNLPAKLNKLGFTPEEARLGVSVEEIVFITNYRVPIGTPKVGCTIKMLKDELNRSTKASYTEDLLKSTLEKLIEHNVLVETGGKLYSITYYGK